MSDEITRAPLVPSPDEVSHRGIPWEPPLPMPDRRYTGSPLAEIDAAFRRGVASLFGKPKPAEPVGPNLDRFADQALGVNRNDPAGAADQILMWVEHGEPDVAKAYKAFGKAMLTAYLTDRLKPTRKGR